MNLLPSLFLNDTIDAELESFCTSDPEFIAAKQAFYKTAHEIAEQIGFDEFDAFERSFHTYMYRTADLYYLFGLGFRQEVLQSMGVDG